MSSANVTTIIKLQGRDSASRAFRSVDRSTRRLKQSLRDVGRMSTAAGGAMGKLGGLAAGLASPLAGVAAGFAAVAAAGEAVEVAREFSKSLQPLATMLPGATARLGELKQNITDIAISSGKDLNEVAAGAFQVVSAFGDAADTAEKLRIVTVAASAGGATASEALGLLSSVTKAYGDTSTEALQSVADLAFMTNKLGQTTFPELAASIGRVAPMAAALGVSQQELFGMFATLTGVTGNAAEVSTQLAAAMAALTKDSTGASKVIKELGFSSAEAIVGEKGFVGALRAITKHGGSSATAIQGLFKRKRAMLAVLPLVSSQADVADEKIAKMGKSSGAAAEAARSASSGAAALAKEMARLDARSQAASVTIGDTFAGAARVAKRAWVGFLEVITLKDRDDAMREIERHDAASFNDISRLYRSASDQARLERAALLRHLRNLPEAFKGGLQGAAKTARFAVSAFVDDMVRGAANIGDRVAKVAARASEGAGAFVRKVQQRELRERKRRAVAAARERARAVAAAEREAAREVADRKRFTQSADAQLHRIMVAAVAKERRVRAAAERQKKAEHAQGLRRLKEQKQANQDLAGAIGQGLFQVADAVVGSNKASAAIRVASALLDAVMLGLRSYPHDPAGVAMAAAGGITAIAQGAKLGAGGGSAPSPQPAPATQSAISDVGPSGGGGRTTVIHVHGGLGTKAEVGAAVKEALDAAKGSGK